MWLTFSRKKFFFLVIILYNLFFQKQKQIFLRIYPFSNIVRKTNFLSISVLFSEIVTFMSKKRSSLWISSKMLQNKRKSYLAICGSLCGEKHFLFIFIPFYWFEQKHLFKQIQIFLTIFPISNMVRKTNWLSILVLVSEIITFMLKEKFSINFPKKRFKK